MVYVTTLRQSETLLWYILITIVYVANTACLVGRYGDTCTEECLCKDDANHCDADSGPTTDCQCIDNYYMKDNKCTPRKYAN